jgi:multidrug efflux pump subunit AcrA (membrane-fusion protein)
VAACLQTTGTLDPYRESKVGPRIAGTVARVLVEEGGRVKEGDPLVQLDSGGFRLAVEEARAALGVAEAQLKQILTGSRPELIGQAQARLNEAQAHLENAAAERRRVESLFQKSTLPQKSLDQAVAHHEASEAAFRSAQEGLRMAKTGATQEEILVARAQMDLARATLHRAEQALADAEVRAPFSGVVIRRFTNEGEYVTTMGQSPLVLLMAMDPLDLKVQIPEVHLLDVAVGNDVEIRPDALPGQVFHGRVTEIIPAVDPVSRTFRALVRIPNPEGRLSPGMFCRVRLSTCMRDSALRVPGEALFRQAGQTLVYLLQEDRIRKRTVTVGTTDERFVEILSGLREGDRVVVTVEGGASLEEGTRVAIRPAPASESNHSPGTRP